MSAISDIEIADAGGLNRVRIAGTSNLQVSWATEQAGLLACQIPAIDLPASIEPTYLENRWLYYAHPTAGAWGGRIVQWNLTDGIVSISAESFLGLMRGYITQTNGETMAIGAYAYQELQLARGRGMRLVLPGNAPRASLETGGAGGQDLYEALMPACLDAAAAEDGDQRRLHTPYWSVDPNTLALSIDDVGRDMSDQVLLNSGDEVSNFSWSEDLSGLATMVYLQGLVQERQVRNRTTTLVQTPKLAVGYSQAGIDRYGVREMVLTRPASVYVGDYALQMAAKRMAHFYSLQYADVTLTIVPRPHEQFAEAWSAFREGDLVSAWLNPGNIRGVVRIESRALDVQRGVMVVGGTGLQVPV